VRQSRLRQLLVAVRNRLMDLVEDLELNYLANARLAEGQEPALVSLDDF
jgi:hypothetical protein